MSGLAEDVQAQPVAEGLLEPLAVPLDALPRALRPRREEVLETLGQLEAPVLRPTREQLPPDAGAGGRGPVQRGIHADAEKRENIRLAALEKAVERVDERGGRAVVRGGGRSERHRQHTEARCVDGAVADLRRERRTLEAPDRCRADASVLFDDDRERLRAGRGVERKWEEVEVGLDPRPSDCVPEPTERVELAAAPGYVDDNACARVLHCRRNLAHRFRHNRPVRGTR